MSPKRNADRLADTVEELTDLVVPGGHAVDVAVVLGDFEAVAKVALRGAAFVVLFAVVNFARRVEILECDGLDGGVGLVLCAHAHYVPRCAHSCPALEVFGCRWCVVLWLAALAIPGFNGDDKAAD